MTKRILTVLLLALALSIFVSAAEISSANDMLTLMNTPSMWADSYTLTTDINLADATNGLSQTPIGTEANPFTGNFDGGDHTISGIDLSGKNYVGLFGYIGGGGTVTVKNLTVSGKVTGTGERIGGIIGQATSTNITVQNCTNFCTVSGGADNVGGIIGRLALSAETVLISGCKNEGAITAGNTYAGGIVGLATNTSGSTTIEKCLNTGLITATKGGAAGIVGYWRVYAGAASKCFVQDCMNKGIITAGASGYAGGIIANGTGKDTAHAVTRCFNTGSVTASAASYVRPIVGRPAEKAVITNCYYTSTDTYTTAATEGEIYVSDAKVAANVSGLGENYILADGYAPELKVFHVHSTDGDYTVTDTKHEKICYCGETVVSGEHTFADGKCTVCGTSEQACTHENKYEVVETAATCVAVGSKYEFCPDCEVKVGGNTEIPVDMANHSGTFSMEFANGEVSYTCASCGNVAYTDSALLTTVYVSENVTGLLGNVTAQIGTAANPFKNFTDAMQYAAYNTEDVTVTILDSATVPATYKTPAFTHTITVTGGTLNTNTRFIMNGPMVFEHICFSDSGNPFIAAQEHKVVMGESITVSGGGIYLVGGYEHGSATSSDIPATGFNADITVRSGVYALISGAHRRVSTAYSGDIHMVIGKTNDADVLEIANFVSTSTTYDGANGVNVTVIIDGTVDKITKFYPVSDATDAGRIDVDFAICGNLGSDAVTVSKKGSDYALNVYSDSRVDGADAFAAIIVGEENVQPYSRFCMKSNGEHPDANADKICDNCGASTVCTHEDGEWVEASAATCANPTKYTWYCYDCVALITEITKDGDVDADKHVSDNFEWVFDGDKYSITCPACETKIEQSDAPNVYVSVNGNDRYDGMTAEKAVATLEEAVSRIANAGGTVVVCGTYPLSSTELPANIRPITIKGSDTVDSFRRGGFKISEKTHLALHGETVLDNLLFDGDATYVISCNWNDVTFGSVEAINNAKAYVILGKYNIKENDDATESATLTITEGAWVSDHLSNTKTKTRFYSQIYLGDTFSSDASADGVSVSNKTATFNATDADIGVLYTMSTSGNYTNNPVLNCETTVNLYGRTRVNNGHTGNKNVDQADSTASLTKQTINFFDDSFIGADYDIINAESTVIYVSGSKDGRTVPMNIGLNFSSYGSFATALTPMNVELNYSTHSFAQSLTAPISFSAAAEAQKVFTENKTDECVFTAKVTVAATPDANGVKLYSCTCGRSYSEEYAYSCEDTTHFYTVNADGSFTCTVCSESFNSVDGENVFAVSSAVVENGVVTITATVNGNFAAAFVNVSLPSGFTFVNATLPTVEGFVCDGNADDGVYSIVLMSNTTEKESVNTEIKLEYAFDSGIEAAGALVEITVPEIYGGDMEKLVATTVCAFTAKNSCEHLTTEDVVTLAPTCTATGLKNVVCADCKTVVSAEVVVEIDSSNHADYVCVSTESGMICNGCKAEIEAPSAPVLIFATPNANANGTIEVIVSVKATTPILAHSFRVNAPEGFTLISAESLIGAAGEDATNFTLTGQDAVTVPYEALVLNMAFEDAIIDAEVLKLTFVAAESGSYVISVNSLETYNYAAEAIDTVSVSAEVSVEEHTHEYEAVITVPNCTTGGYTTYTCACGDTYVADEVAALGHTEEILPAVEPTYDSTGLTEGKKCSVCGEILVAQEEIPALENPVIPGDIDGDERVTVLDALMLIRAIVNDETIENGDVNGDGKVGLADVIRVMKLIAN